MHFCLHLTPYCSQDITTSLSAMLACRPGNAEAAASHARLTRQLHAAAHRSSSAPNRPLLDLYRLLPKSATTLNWCSSSLRYLYKAKVIGPTDWGVWGRRTPHAILRLHF